jgi:Flp pilus assembly protein TadG
MVTVETALAIPVLLAATALAAWLPAVVGVQAACTGAARDAALLVARGATPHAAEQAVVALLRRPAELEVSVEGDVVVARVTARVQPPWGQPALALHGRSVAVAEP